MLNLKTTASTAALTVLLAGGAVALAAPASASSRPICDGRVDSVHCDDDYYPRQPVRYPDPIVLRAPSFRSGGETVFQRPGRVSRRVGPWKNIGVNRALLGLR